MTKILPTVRRNSSLLVRKRDRSLNNYFIEKPVVTVTFLPLGFGRLAIFFLRGGLALEEAPTGGGGALEEPPAVSDERYRFDVERPGLTRRTCCSGCSSPGTKHTDTRNNQKAIKNQINTTNMNQHVVGNDGTGHPAVVPCLLSGSTA